jgi:hypothetical protein
LVSPATFFLICFKVVDADSDKDVDDDNVGEKHEDQEEDSQEG